MKTLFAWLVLLLAGPSAGALLAGPDLNPRDIVVMVPDVQLMAPAIRAVFGQYPRQDRRHIPFDIADLSARASSPVVSAIEWLLRLPGQRCGLSELVDLLDGALARFADEQVRNG